MTEEERAELWRQQQRRRAAYRRAQHVRLAAPPGPAQAVRDAWEPVRAWLRERRR